MNRTVAMGNYRVRCHSFVFCCSWVWPLWPVLSLMHFIFKGIEVARRIRDEERGGKAKLVIIGK